MKLSVDAKALATSVKAINKCLNRRPHLPILGGINLRAGAEALELTSTDMMVGLRVKIPAQIETEGEATVAGKNFVEAVSFFDAPSVSLELQEKEMLVRSGRDRVKIPVLTDAFPQFDDSVATEEVSKKGIDFWKAIVGNVAFAASSDQSRPALTGILLKSAAEKTQIVCTDGFRLAIWETSEPLLAAEGAVIVGARALAELVAIAEVLGEKSIGFYHNAEAEQIVFSGDGFVFFSKLINTNYPPFEKIVPLEFATEVTLEREALIRNLTKASVFTRADSNTVRLHVGEASVDFSASTLGDGSFQGQQEVVKKTGSELEISFNIKYLLDFLNTRTGETVWLGCNSPTTPAMLKDPGAPELTYIAMPFKPKN